MSAIAAIAAAPGERVDVPHFQRWSRTIEKRGPDGFHTWTSNEAAMAAADLCIYPGWPEVPEPFSLDGDVWIVSDARIDAQEELREKLRSAGVSVSRQVSDAELILQAYRSWGTGCAEHLFGDFAFVIWDAQVRRLLAVRDRFGARPLYYSLTRRGLLLSNDANALFRHPEVDRTPDDETIADFLVNNGFGPDDATAFRGIRRVRASHQLVWEDGRLLCSRYWSVPVEDPLKVRDDRDLGAEFWHLVRTATLEVTRGTPVGVLLSGGLDSPMIAAALAGRGADGRVRGHTSVWRDLLPDHERPFAELITRSLGIPGELHAFDAWPAFDRANEVQLASPIPDGSPFSVDTHELFRGVGLHTRLALTGLGPDALLRREPLVPRLARGPQRLRTAAAAAAYVRRAGKRPPLGIRPWLARRRATSALPPWLPPHMISLARAASRQRGAARALHPHRPEAYQATASWYWPGYLEWYQSAARAAGVCCAHPFFDVRVVRFALRVPAVPWSWDKQLLRVAVGPHLPQEVVNRPKTPLVLDRLEAYVRRHGTEWMDASIVRAYGAAYVDGSEIANLAAAYRREPDWIHVRPICIGHFLQSWSDQRVV